MKETYLSRDFRETAAQRFPAQAKELNAAFDARLNALLAENAGAGKEKQYHLKRQILPGIAAYETLQRVMPKEEALQTVHGYVERLEANWRKLVKPEDTIVLAGDISWAMRLTDTRRDFEFLQQLPGQKLIMKGNHDYWWTTANKMNTYLKAEGFDTLHILHNNSYSVEGYAICGTRGWLFDVGEPHDEKVMNREIGRLKMSLEAAEPGLEKLVFLHYPPVYTGTSAPEIVATLKAYGIRTCYYGHLHGNAIRYAVQGDVDGIRYKLVSADGLRFCPYRIN